MSLIRCKACFREVSDKATKCPNCGHVIAGKECPECGTILEKKTKICSRCGNPFNSKKKYTDGQNMGLTKCPSCFARVSRKAKNCPFCGRPISSYVCPECGNLFGQNDTMCSKCGNPIEFKRRHTGKQFSLKALFKKEKSYR